jgi:hypothetical protein
MTAACRSFERAMNHSLADDPSAVSLDCDFQFIFFSMGKHLHMEILMWNHSRPSAHKNVIGSVLIGLVEP